MFWILQNLPFTKFSILSFNFFFIIFDQSRMDQKSDPRDPNSWPRFILMVDQYMSDYLTKGKKSKLAVLSSSLKVWIVLKVHLIILFVHSWTSFLSTSALNLP